MTKIQHALPAVHIDLNQGQDVSLSHYSTCNITEALCAQIIAQTLQTVQSSENSRFTPHKPVSLSIYLVHEPEGKQLNHSYRHKDYATNVLSFESELPDAVIDELADYPLGELVICLPVVQAEAEQQGKRMQHHFTHLLVHGCLHLLGYDHELSDTVSQADAAAMESLEVEILAMLGIENPYTAIDDNGVKQGS